MKRRVENLFSLLACDTCDPRRVACIAVKNFFRVLVRIYRRSSSSSYRPRDDERCLKHSHTQNVLPTVHCMRHAKTALFVEHILGHDYGHPLTTTTKRRRRRRIRSLFAFSLLLLLLLLLYCTTTAQLTHILNYFPSHTNFLEERRKSSIGLFKKASSETQKEEYCRRGRGSSLA